MARGLFSRDPVTGQLIHHPTREREDLRGGGGPGGVPPGPPGEDNTGSNVNTRGIGVFEGKVGVDLQFRGIDDPSNRILVTYDDPDNVLDLNIDEDALTTLAHLMLNNTFSGDNTFNGAVTVTGTLTGTGPVDFTEWLDLDNTGADPGNPAASRYRLYTRIDSGNIELVARNYLGDICVLCSHAIPAGVNTLPIMWVEV